jgi:hypothetical protein
MSDIPLLNGAGGLIKFCFYKHFVPNGTMTPDFFVQSRFNALAAA